MKKTKTSDMRAALRTIVLLNIFALAGVQPCLAQSAENLPELAEQIAAKIYPDFELNKPSSGQLRVGVFKFTDKDNKYPTEMGNLGITAAALLQDELRTKLSLGTTTGKYTVLSQTAIDLVFSATSSDQIAVFTPNTTLTRAECDKAGIKVVVLVRFLFDKVEEVRTKQAADPTIPVDVEVKVIFPSTEMTYTFQVKPNDVLISSGLGPLPPVGGNSTGTIPSVLDPKTARLFDVEFYLRVNLGNTDDSDPSVWEQIPLKVAANPSSADYGTFFLELDEAKHKDKRFKIRLKYKGPRSVVTDRLAKDRIYAAALVIDGLDSFFHSNEAKFVHASQAKKWVLTNSGRRIVSDPGKTMNYPSPYAWNAATNPPTPRDEHPDLKLGDSGRIGNGKIQDASGDGNSVADVPGFQRNAKYADAFVFKTGGESVANLAGSVADVGEIKVYFYGEPLPLAANTPTSFKQGGVGAGVKIENPVFPIQLRLDRDPREVWTIKYRYANSNNPAPGGLTPVTAVFP